MLYELLIKINGNVFGKFLEILFINVEYLVV